MIDRTEARKEAEKDERYSMALAKLQRAGAYSRTIDRWWNGFYTNWQRPTVEQTIEMTPAEIEHKILVGSRRG